MSRGHKRQSATVTNDNLRLRSPRRKQEAAYPPAKGDEGEGSILGAVFFAYKNKKTTLYLSGLLQLTEERWTTIIEIKLGWPFDFHPRPWIVRLALPCSFQRIRSRFSVGQDMLW